jgi:hypothetical protein
MMCIILLSSCATVKKYIDPQPPLKESEIPWVMKAGIYQDAKNIPHMVTKEHPRWCISEAYLYDSVSSAKTDSFESYKKHIINLSYGLLGLIFFTSIIKLIIAVITRKRE